jgi:hypothetical protein
MTHAGGVWSPTSSETLDRGAAILTLTDVGEKEVDEESSQTSDRIKASTSGVIEQYKSDAALN